VEPAVALGVGVRFVPRVMIGREDTVVPEISSEMCEAR
jgi:hypothetical protein